MTKLRNAQRSLTPKECQVKSKALHLLLNCIWEPRDLSECKCITPRMLGQTTLQRAWAYQECQSARIRAQQALPY